MREVITEEGFPHGEVRGYSAGCGCDSCRDAIRRYELNRRTQRAYGRWNPLVSAQPVREHLQHLREQGMAAKAVSEASGVPVPTIRNLTDRPERVQVRNEIAETLLAVRFDPALLPETSKIPGAGALRRARALAAFGYTFAWQAEQMGRRRDFCDHLRKTGRCSADLWRDIAALYEKYSTTPAPDSLGGSRARRNAQAQGWPNPFQWEPEHLDLPDDELERVLREEAGRMTYAETQRCHIAKMQGDVSPLIVAGARERSRRNKDMERARSRRRREGNP